MLRKLPSVALMALGLGLGVTEHPAQAASYAGGASMRFCPVPQECGGHVQYQLQRQTVLQNVQETVYETQQVPCVRTSARRSCSRGPSRRCVTSSSSTSGKRPTRCSGPCYRTVNREVHYTVQRPVTRTDLEGRARTRSAGRSARRTTRPSLHGLPAGPRDHDQDVRLQRLPAGPRDVVQGRAPTRSAGRQETVIKTVNETVCRPGAGDLLQDVSATRSAGRSRRSATGRSRTPCRCRSRPRSCSASRPP